MEICGSREMKDGMRNEWKKMIWRRETESGLGGETWEVVGSGRMIPRRKEELCVAGANHEVQGKRCGKIIGYVKPEIEQIRSACKGTIDGSGVFFVNIEAPVNRIQIKIRNTCVIGTLNNQLTSKEC